MDKKTGPTENSPCSADWRELMYVITRGIGHQHSGRTCGQDTVFSDEDWTGFVMESRLDCIVVGAGIQGSAAAYYLAANGLQTLLIEQFPLPHSRGSSHGPSRITRKAYADFDQLTYMMNDAYKLWTELENNSGVTLFKQAGMLTVGKSQNPSIEGSVRYMKKYEMPYEVLAKEDNRKRYPMLNFPPNFTFMIDKDAGVLHADKALLAFQTLFKKHGGEIKDGEKVETVSPGDICSIQTSKGEYRCRHLVLTTGPWSKPFMSTLHVTLPLRVIKVIVLYWPEKNKGEYSLKRFPTFYHENAIGSFSVFGTGSYEYEGMVKLCLHEGPEVDPDTRDFSDQSLVINLMSSYVAEHFPGLIPRPSIVESCMYTISPDRLCVLDRHPLWRNIIIGAGFSGHGFKLSPVIGKMISEMVMNKPVSHSLEPFRVNRFQKSSRL
ncbi:hypothetical protein FSP39_018701 [Pinctada imbricata]|uniref:FAD dependent oxidoreductase domain-containing protein n=1 Tax=Pinctada imbricata TaxID=66713 RepID=A0AA88XT61_PINIB|nr:hypothetical protein FSP39_018701 [Pinctada imbricata]